MAHLMKGGSASDFDEECEEDNSGWVDVGFFF